MHGEIVEGEGKDELDECDLWKSCIADSSLNLVSISIHEKRKDSVFLDFS